MRVSARLCVWACVIKMELKSLLGPKTNSVGALLSSHLLKLGTSGHLLRAGQKKTKNKSSSSSAPRPTSLTGHQIMGYTQHGCATLPPPPPRPLHPPPGAIHEPGI